MRKRTSPLFVRLWAQAPAALTALALLALAAGLGGTAALVLAPAPPAAPPLLAEAPPPPPATHALAAWFGSKAVRPDIRVTGLISTGKDGVALLSVGQEPPRAFRTGQEIAAGMRLDAVHAAAVVVVHNGQAQEIVIDPDHTSNP